MIVGQPGQHRRLKTVARADSIGDYHTHGRNVDSMG
jgi:hypothetical protein